MNEHSAFCPALTPRGALMAEFQNFRVREQFRQLESRSQIPNNCERIVLHFPEIKLNTPTVYMFSEPGFRTCIVDSFELEHSFLFFERTPAGDCKHALLDVP